MQHDQWVLYSVVTLVLCVLWYIWKLLFPRKYISRDEELSAMNAFCEKNYPLLTVYSRAAFLSSL